MYVKNIYIYIYTYVYNLFLYSYPDEAVLQRKLQGYIGFTVISSTIDSSILTIRLLSKH